MLDLPSEGVFQRILSFLDYSERLDLTLVFKNNKRVLEEVETYSKTVYEAMKREHRVDQTFDARVRDQSNLKTDKKSP